MPANRQSGQVVLILILTVIIGMTVGLAIYFDSLTDVTLTSTEDRSERAFNAAEGGVEDLISRDDTEIAQIIAANAGNPLDVTVGGEDGITAKVEVAQRNIIESLVNQNDVLTVKLEGVTNTKVRISWTHPDEPGIPCEAGDGKLPGIIIERWYLDGTKTKLDRKGYSAYGCNLPDAQLTMASLGADPGFESSIEMDVTNQDLFLRVQPIFNQTLIYAHDPYNSALPSQSLDIVSKASAGPSNETRAIKANRSYSDLPSIFDYTVFSGTDLVKE